MKLSPWALKESSPAIIPLHTLECGAERCAGGTELPWGVHRWGSVTCHCCMCTLLWTCVLDLYGHPYVLHLDFQSVCQVLWVSRWAVSPPIAMCVCVCTGFMFLHPNLFPQGMCEGSLGFWLPENDGSFRGILQSVWKTLKGPRRSQGCHGYREEAPFVRKKQLVTVRGS